MPRCLFVTDLHGHPDRYRTLFRLVDSERPDLVFLGGDLLPHFGRLAVREGSTHADFLDEVIAGGFRTLRERLGSDYPTVFAILGNDDGRMAEEAMRAGEAEGLWVYAHNSRVETGAFTVYGYAYVPPTPFLLKDWERYDVSRYVDPGCVSPEEGWRSIPVEANGVRYATIKQDLEDLTGFDDLERAVFLFHTPPYKTHLDRAALDGKQVDHVSLDVHVGSIAVRRFIKQRQPLVTLHGHVHESPRLTGSWRDRIGRTHLFSAAHDGPELAVVRFDLDRPGEATRELVGREGDPGQE